MSSLAKPALSAPEKRALLERLVREKGLCLHHLFEVQARRTPDRVAVDCGGQELTYAELNARANRLAHHLRRHGAGPDSIIGVSMPRSVEMITALLGILKAGAAYVALEPELPDAWRAWIMDTVQPQMVLESADVAESNEENPPASAKPENLCYIACPSRRIVRIEHRVAAQRLFPPSSPDASLFRASLHHESSVHELWRALASGSSVTIAPVEAGGAVHTLPEAAGPVPHVYILDAYMQAVPVGVPGEIYVGGFLARGAARHALDGKPVFKTGDLARRRPDGEIEPLGCVPGQARVNGFRVYLEEVEAVLLAEPGIVDAKVLERGGELVAYVAPAGPFAIDAWRDRLASQLPSWMLPAAYVPVSSLPLAEDGSVDEAALVRLPVIDRDSEQRWEQALRALPGVGDVEVTAGRRVESLPRLPAPLSFPPPEEEERDAELGPPAPLAIADGGPLHIPERAPATLTEALLRTARLHPDRSLVFASDTELTYPALLEEARPIAAGLLSSGLRAGQSAILQIPSLRDSFPAFWGCVLAGVRPVTVAVSPSYKEKTSLVSKLLNVWELLDRPPVIAEDGVAEALRGLDLPVLPLGRLRREPPLDHIHECRPEDVLFFQLTSGSTGTPKCIQITHRGVIAHIHGAQQFNGYTSEDVSLNWLPADHVVPILTCHLKDVYLGCRQVEIPTAAVLADPLVWLDAIEKYRVTHTWSPNFGFKLVSDALRNAGARSWDLSSIKFFMNAGEQVTVPVVSEFLRRVAPFGVRESALQPAFGMAEACTCMTFTNDFSLENSVDGAFVDLGPPVAGVEIRITDKQNRPLAEGVVGRFQIKGDVITPGYFKNESANREAFVGGGWFNSGDLGFIRNGRLALTGREKEMIVIHGANLYCYEVEDIVNQVDGVEPTFAAACGIADAATGSEALAIFFSPRAGASEPETAADIRRTVTARLGVSPSHVVPVAKAAFPKTTSGKIQRTRLKESLSAGAAPPEATPDWFYREVWRKRRLACLSPRELPGPALIFLDDLGLGAFLGAELERGGRPWIGVEPGTEFRMAAPGRYRLDPANPEHYRLLMQSLADRDFHVDDVIHLWTYSESSPVEDLEQAQQRGVSSVKYLAQQRGVSSALCLAQQRGVSSVLYLAQRLTKPARLTVVSSYVRPVGPKIAVEKGALPGLLLTIPQEMDWLGCRHIDLAVEPADVNGGAVLQELRALPAEPQVAWRGGERWVPRLERAPVAASGAGPAVSIKAGGRYLITGGTGGIGAELARCLTARYRAKVRQLGRAAADVADLDAMRAAVAEAESSLGGPFDGVFHLAGVAGDRLLIDETPESFAAVMRPKVLGAWTLHRIFKDRPDTFVAHWSSLNGLFGGVRAGAYSAANSFLGALCHGAPANYCFYWSRWDGLGMSRDFGMKEFSEARGYCSIGPEQGLLALFAGLRNGHRHLLVGLDGSNPYIRPWVSDHPRQLLGLSARFRSPDGAVPEETVRDRFETPLPCDLLRIDESGASRVSSSQASPRSGLERQLVEIWSQTLQTPRVGVNDNFFELGGHSMMAARLIFQLRKTLGIEMPVSALFENPTVARMAKWVEESRSLGEAAPRSLPECVLPLQPGGRRLPFFCVHPAGGSPLCYSNLAAHLGGDQPFYGFQSPGLLDGKEPLTRVEDLARLYVDAMRAWLPEGPYLLGAWSSGGPVAFEMARVLEMQGEPVALLAFFDCGLMESDNPMRGRGPLRYLKAMMMLVTFVAHVRIPRSYGELRYLGQLVGVSLPPAFRDFLRRVVRPSFLKGFAAEILHSLKIFQTNTAAGLNYRPALYGGKATLFRTPGRSRDRDPVLEDLRTFAQGGVESLEVKGNHMSIILDPEASKLLAARVRETLDRHNREVS